MDIKRTEKGVEFIFEVPKTKEGDEVIKIIKNNEKFFNDAADLPITPT